MIREYVAVPASAGVFAHAEGPLAGIDDGVLWVDIPTGTVWQGTVHGMDVVDAHPLCVVDTTVGAALHADRHGRPSVILLAGTSILEWMPSGPPWELTSLPGVDPALIRFNDAKVDPFGAVVAGTMAFDAARGSAALYRLRSDGALESLLTGVTISNGLAWSPDGTTMYYIDSGNNAIERFGYSADEALGPRTRFAEIGLPTDSRAPGAPDGMCIDSDEHLWVAVWGSGEVRRYSPDGRLVAVVTVEASNVSSCAFVGRDHDRLMITTSLQGVSTMQHLAQPQSGRLFLADVGVTGLAPAIFRGHGG